MTRRFWTAVLILGTFACALALKGENSVFGLQFTFAPPNNPTIPTRTPTPGPATSTPRPTATKSGGGGGGNPTAVPTGTNEPVATETVAPTITATFIPEGEILPTAEGCGEPPTIQAQNPTNVRAGPGSDYAIVGTLTYLDVRPIIGRAAAAEWWLIQLEGGVVGWVFDAIVAVQGYTGNVPIAPLPPINGQTPTPGAPWNPTPNPICTVVPTNTAVPTLTSEPTIESGAAATPTTASNETESPSSDNGNETTASEAAANETTDNPSAAQSAPTDEPLPTQTAVSPPTLAAPNAAESSLAESGAAYQTVDDSVATETPAPSAAAPSLDDAPSASPVDWLLPVSGLLLIAAGGAAFVAQRRS